MKHRLIVLTVVCAALALAGCETPSGQLDRTATGALLGGAIGAGTGAIIGSTTRHAGQGAVIGGALGAITGGLIGGAIDQAQKERLREQAPQTLQRIEQGQPLGLADIKALAKAGVSDDVIISQIRNSRVVYRLTTAEIIELKEAGVSNRVIDYMINTPSTSGGSPSSSVIRYEETVVVPAPPPPLIVERVVPAPAPGYVWIPGDWVWHGGRWVWVEGRWVKPPYRHATWVRPRCENRGGVVVWFSGHWR